MNIKIKILPFIFLLCNGLHAQDKSDTAAIQQIISDETQSWNNKDAVQYARHFAPDGTFTNLLGMYFKGYAFFLDRHQEVFKTVFAGTELRQQTVSIRFADANVAVVETLTTLSHFSKNGPPPGTRLNTSGELNTRLLQTLIRKNNEWQVIAYHNVDVKAGVPIPETSGTN